ncbi:MAG: hypothetical protein J6Y16_08505 [Treponema sp.]|nr:hypothetical protein [Treponema sp.]MBP5452262.1 hypothetical protein [Treponema sp.]
MKKSVLMILMVLAGSLFFADVFPNSEKIVEDFWKNGSYVKIIKDENNIRYVAKVSVAGISIDEDDIEIAMTGYSVWTGKEGASNASFSVKKYDIESDSNGNLVISPKKK